MDLDFFYPPPSAPPRQASLPALLTPKSLRAHRPAPKAPGAALSPGAPRVGLPGLQANPESAPQDSRRLFRLARTRGNTRPPFPGWGLREPGEVTEADEGWEGLRTSLLT